MIRYIINLKIKNRGTQSDIVLISGVFSYLIFCESDKKKYG